MKNKFVPVDHQIYLEDSELAYSIKVVDNVVPYLSAEAKEEYQLAVVTFAKSLYDGGYSIETIKEMFRHGLNEGVLSKLDDFIIMAEALE